MAETTDVEPEPGECRCPGGPRSGRTVWHVPSCPRHPDYSPDVVTLADMLATGATYRQLDWWARAGHLGDNPDGPGSGRQRRWTIADRDLVRLILAFSAHGFAIHRAVALAKMTLDPDQPNVATIGAMTITWETHDQPDQP